MYKTSMITVQSKGQITRIIGIDPGLATAGFGIIEGNAQHMHAVYYGVITTPGDMPLPARLRSLYDAMVSLLHDYQPQEIAVEELFYGRNVTTALTVGQARGVFLLAAEQRGLEYSHYTPAEVKMAVTGYGKADKAQIQQMVKLLLGLSAVPKPDDAADALAIAICHMQSRAIKRAVLQKG